jgi:tetratricopeptide (TPR) repeat protein
MKRDKLFICYSHKDREWHDRIRILLKPVEARTGLIVWSDQDIPPGAQWRNAIQVALDSTKIAVVLASDNLLASDFITRTELLYFLEREQLEGLIVFPIPVRAALFEESELGRFQFATDPQKPLSSLPEAVCDLKLTELVRKIVSHFGKVPNQQSVPGRVDEEQVDLRRFDPSSLLETPYVLFGRERELQRLNDAWFRCSSRVLTLVADGGMGKTALVRHWVTNLRNYPNQRWAGAESVFVWSFDRQGSNLDAQASWEPFIIAAFRFFGLKDENQFSSWDKGLYLAEELRSRRCLLVLDGLEVLQELPTPGEQAGKLRDQGMSSFLLNLLSGPDCKCLCVATTRRAVANLSSLDSSGHQQLDLEYLEDNAGAELLRHLLAPPEALSRHDLTCSVADLMEASREFGGHALALRLLAKYLVIAHNGDIARRSEIGPVPPADETKSSRHARRVFRKFEEHFKGRKELEVLQLLGLFDRRAERGAIDAVRKTSGFVERSLRDHDTEWNQAVDSLLQTGLVSEDRDGSLDGHPLVREYFGERLRADNPSAWRAANLALYEYFRDLPVKTLPDSWEETAPLFQAVLHACKAGRFGGAKELYEYRIVGWRPGDGKTVKHQDSFAMRRFGASDLYLSTLHNFFQKPWTIPSAHLGLEEQAFVLHEAGHYLFLLGRLNEAIEPMRLSMRLREEGGWLKDASRGARLIREVHICLGELQKAYDVCKDGRDIADRSQSRFQRMGLRAALGQVLSYMGETQEAKAIFAEAEGIQKERSSKYPLLTYIWGFWYCEMLMDEVERLIQSSSQDAGRVHRPEADSLLESIETRASKAREVAEHWNSFFDIAHDELTLGRAAYLRALLHNTGPSNRANALLNSGIDGIRKTGQEHHLVAALVVRAGYRRFAKNLKGAESDLMHGFRIAERAGMALHRADLCLELSRLRHDQNNSVDEQRLCKEARSEIQRMGYKRRYLDVGLV